MVLHGRRVPGGADGELAGARVEHQVHRGGEALDPLLAQQVGVGRGQELRHPRAAHEPAEPAGQQQRPGPRPPAPCRRRRPRPPPGRRASPGRGAGAPVGAGRRAVGRTADSTKSPENPSPLAERWATSMRTPSGIRAGRAWARSRSRRSTSMAWPVLPWTPSTSRVRTKKAMSSPVRTMTTMTPGVMRLSRPAQHGRDRDARRRGRSRRAAGTAAAGSSPPA